MTLNASVPVAVGVPLVAMLPVPLPGMIKPDTAFVTWTVNDTAPVPPAAAIVWL